jgi:hypothetical protein
MSLRDELLNDPAGLGYDLADRALVERLINEPTRARTVPTEVGNGTILEVLGLATGNALLDVMYGNSDFRHVKPLLEQGRLRLDSPLTRAALDSLVGFVLTEAQAEALKAKATQPCSRGEELGLGQVNDQMIREALE